MHESLKEQFGVNLSMASAGTLLARIWLTPQKLWQQACQRDPVAVNRWKRETYPCIVCEANREKAESYFWDESDIRAYVVKGKNWSIKGNTPVVSVPGQRQGISAASVVNSKGGFWFATCSGGLNVVLIVDLLRKLMKGRHRSVQLTLDGLPAHKAKFVHEYVTRLKGKITLHFQPSYTPDQNPDKLVWNYTKHTGVARSPLRSGEKLADSVHATLADITTRPDLVRSFFKHPTVAYITDS